MKTNDKKDPRSNSSDPTKNAYRFYDPDRYPNRDLSSLNDRDDLHPGDPALRLTPDQPPDIIRDGAPFVNALLLWWLGIGLSRAALRALEECVTAAYDGPTGRLLFTPEAYEKEVRELRSGLHPVIHSSRILLSPSHAPEHFYADGYDHEELRRLADESEDTLTDWFLRCTREFRKLSEAMFRTPGSDSAGSDSDDANAEGGR